MPELTPEEKREIVRSELNHLVQSKYIPLKMAAKIVHAHTNYYKNLAKEEIKQEKQPDSELQMTITPRTIDEPTPKNTSEKSINKQKKVLTAKQIRERNITWGLNLGVILLLLGGLVLATSTWETLGNWMKTGLIAAVSALFYCLAWLTNRVLHIKKTAFAFLVLGSLFLPIVVVSAGYFSLFGSYLSFNGEGKYIFGALGTLIVLPIYILLARKFLSRLFVWFSYAALSILVGLLLAALYMPVDGFYLGIMLYNAVLILGYRKLKGSPKLNLYSKEFIPFIQANLILSTLLMLVFYDQQVIYSINLLLTAVIYFSMIYVTKHTSYHFVFTAMLIYGAYQLVENSLLIGVGDIAYALLGIIFLLLPKFLKDDHSLHKIFRLTSAVVSSLAFLYISYEGLMLRMGEGSYPLLIAYVIIALNFTFLANIENQKLFTYLGPIFSLSALYQLALLGKDWFGYQEILLPLFILAFLFYLVGGCFLTIPLWQKVKESTRDMSGLAMLALLWYGLLELSKLELSVMFLLLGVTAIVMNHYENRKAFLQVAPWMHAITIGFAATLLYAHLMNQVLEPLEIPGQFAIAGILVLVVHFIWGKLNSPHFAKASLYVAQLFYGLSIIASLGFSTEPIIRALVAFGGIGMAFLLYQKKHWRTIPYVLSSITLLFYISSVYAIQTNVDSFPMVLSWFEFEIGAIILLGIGLLIGNKEHHLTKAYKWVGQIYLPIALLVSLFFHGEDAIWVFLVATIIYGLTVKQVKEEWQLRIFFYAGCTTLWAFMVLLFMQLNWDRHVPFAFFLVSVLLLIGWVYGTKAWKNRIAYYFLSFSSVGILAFILSYPYSLLLFSVTILYCVLVLFVMHRMKWDVVTIFPLLLAYLAVSNFVDSNMLEFKPFIHAVFGIALTISGFVLYKTLYVVKKNYFQLDWYTIIAAIVFLYMYQMSQEGVTEKILPGILLAGLLFINRKRIPDVSANWMVFAAGLYLLQPYYAWLGQLEIPALFEREIYVLPWIIFAVVLRVYVMKENRVVTNYIQWAVLVIVAILLVQDGLASNTINDAIIIGVLSLASLLAGMIYQAKSFFFVGAGVLLFNVFMQTKPYWGRLPWWGYLLIAGSILIAIASYNEWQKQQSVEGKDTLVSKFKRNVLERMKKWD